MRPLRDLTPRLCKLRINLLVMWCETYSAFAAVNGAMLRATENVVWRIIILSKFAPHATIIIRVSLTSCYPVATCRDWSRREREDPLNFINSTLSNQKQHQQSSRNVNNLIIKESALSRSLIADNFRGRDTSTAVDMAANIDISDDDSGSSDPEAAFLSSLTSKEKVLLLRKLEVSNCLEENFNVGTIMLFVSR